MSHPFFQMKQVSVSYGKQEILHNLNFTLEEGSLTGILGPNGCGKTTLLRTICGLLPCTGTIALEGVSLKNRKPKELAKLLSYIPQKSSPSLALSILDMVLMGFNPILKTLQNPSKQQHRLAVNALEQVGLKGLENTSYLELSEGQKQLTILARTLIENTRLLLLDEPDSALDFSNRHKILSYLRQQITVQNQSALISLHDPNLAFEFCDGLILMKDGDILDTVSPKTDSVPQLKKALSQILGPVTIIEAANSSEQNYRVIIPGL